MDMVENNNLEEQLISIKWISCLIGNKEYILKYLWSDSSYCLMISDFTNLYFETLSDLEIERRCQHLNPGIEVSLQRIVKQLKKCVEQLPQTGEHKSGISTFMVEVQTPALLQVKCDSVLAQMSFLWRFTLESKEPVVMSTHLLQPLVGMVSELKRRNVELLKIIKNKDEEIKDYKMSGSKVSRRNLETKIFNEEEFLNTMDKSQDMIDHLRNPAKSAFDCNLYSVVCSVLKKSSSEIGEENEGPSETKKVKNSCKEETDVNAISTKDQKSVNKKEENQRRLLLQQQLDLKVKKKSKKKLFKI